MTPTKSLVLAGVDASFDSFAAITRAYSTAGYTQAATDQIRELAEVRLAATEEVLGGRSYNTAGELLDLEAVLHPDTDSRNSGLRPIGDETFEKYDISLLVENARCFQRSIATVRDLGPVTQV